MTRKITAFALILALVTALAPGASAVWVTDPGSLRGADFTDDPALAAGLDRVFRGEIDLYSDLTCSVPAPARIGCRDVPLGRYLFVRSPGGTVYSGTSCYIYANAVYATLFGDVPYHGEPLGWTRSYRAMEGGDSISCERFLASSIRCGALLRTTPNPDGSYNSERGHSVIILSYDKRSVTYLEGNADGRGLIRVTSLDWSAANRVLFSSRGYRLSFVVQPADRPTEEPVAAGPGLLGYLRPIRTYSGQFKDVPSGAWYAGNVGTMFSLGLMSGRDETRFAPGGNVTAAEAVTIAARFLSAYYDDGHVFSPGGSWYAPYYEYLSLWGIDTSFAAPGAAITRGQFAALMARVLPEDARSESCPGVTFPDVGGEFRACVELLARCGIVGGSGGAFRPDACLTRSETAAIVTRMADLSLRLGA